MIDFSQLLFVRDHELELKRVEIDPDAAEKLRICRADFMYALENDIKPVCEIFYQRIDWIYILENFLGIWC
jgi:hypothetical protein